MKPKTREPQKQSSRLYFRRRDHREVIMDEMYHNAIWLTKEEEDEKIDKLVWVKYPKEQIMAMANGSGGWLGWYDPNRQFQYGIEMGGPNNVSKIWQLDGLDCALCSVVYGDGSNSNSAYYVTTDGMTWHTVKNRPLSGVFPNAVYFGNKGFCYYSGITNGMYDVYVSELEHDEENDTWHFINNILHISGAALGSLMFICNTNEGAIFMEYTEFNDNSGNRVCEVQYVKIDREGNRHEGFHELQQWNQPYPVRSSRGWDYCKMNNVCCYIHCARENQNKYVNYWFYRIVVTTTNDFGETINTHIFETWEDNDYYQGRFSIFCRDNTVYVVYGNYLEKKFHMYKTADGVEWEEVMLPSWIDLPVIKEEGGAAVDYSFEDEVRIAIRPDECPSYKMTMYNLLPFASGGGGWARGNNKTLNRSSYGIQFKDGEIVKAEDTEFFVVFGNDLYSWMAYFDNEYLASSTLATAWSNSNIVEVEGYGETIQDNDYVVR